MPPVVIDTRRWPMESAKQSAFAAIVSRVSAMVFHPKREWATVAAESASVSDILRYVAVIAGAPALVRLVTGFGFAPTVTLFAIDVGTIVVLARVLSTLASN